jgi:hypothetical protein
MVRWCPSVSADINGWREELLLMMMMMRFLSSPSTLKPHDDEDGGNAASRRRRRSPTSACSVRFLFALVVFVSALSIQTLTMDGSFTKGAEDMESSFLLPLSMSTATTTTTMTTTGTSIDRTPIHMPSTTRAAEQHSQNEIDFDGGHERRIENSTNPMAARTSTSVGGTTTPSSARTTAAPSTGNIRPHDVEKPPPSFDVAKIPQFMRDYFDWHKRQLMLLHSGRLSWTMNDEDADDDDDRNARNGTTSSSSSPLPPPTDNIITKEEHRQQQQRKQQQDRRNHHQPRFLIMRCIRGDRCGGTSDRLKAFPLFVLLAHLSKRILLIRWGHDRPFPLETFMTPGPLWNWTVPAPLLPILQSLDDDDDTEEEGSRRRQQQRKHQKQQRPRNKDNPPDSASGNVTTAASSANNGNATTAGRRKRQQEEEESSALPTSPRRRRRRVYYDGKNFRELRKSVDDATLWMVEGNDYSGGGRRYERLILNELAMQRQRQQERGAIENNNQTSTVQVDGNNDVLAPSNEATAAVPGSTTSYYHLTSNGTTTIRPHQAVLFRPRDASYTSFYHDLFHASFQPSSAVRELLDDYFAGDGDQDHHDWQLTPDRYIVAHYRAKVSL